MIFPSYERGEVPADQRRANLETVRRVRGVVADLVEAERRRRAAEGLITSWDLGREELDEAAGTLGVPPLEAEESDAPHDGEAARGASR
jgi:hypothetical protein